MAKHTKRKPEETRGRKPWVHIKLKIKHNVNGISYGPGLVHVEPNLASVLLDQESRFAEVDEKLRTQGAAIIGAGNRVIPVSSEMFDDTLARISPGIKVLGGER